MIVPSRVEQRPAASILRLCPPVRLQLRIERDGRRCGSLGEWLWPVVIGSFLFYHVLAYLFLLFQVNALLWCRENLFQFFIYIQNMICCK